MRFNLDALPQIGQQTTSDGTPLMLPIEAIDEDPKQPRCEFDPEPLQQLAASITQRGVLQAISVRRHPDQADRWMLNFGARRLRASRLAGLAQIPATVNETATSYDQVIENEHREGLKPLELALFVQSRLALGDSQAEIARGLGKGASYVTYATALIDAPDWLMTLYREGRCRGLRELHELRQLEKLHPECVRELETRPGLITREVLVSLKLKTKSSTGGDVPSAPQEGRAQATASIDPQRSTSPIEKPVRTSTARETAARGDEPHSRSLCLWAELDSHIFEVVTDAAPAEDGKIFVRAAPGEQVQSVDAASLRLLRISGDRRDRSTV